MDVVTHVQEIVIQIINVTLEKQVIGAAIGNAHTDSQLLTVIES